MPHALLFSPRALFVGVVIMIVEPYAAVSFTADSRVSWSKSNGGGGGDIWDAGQSDGGAETAPIKTFILISSIHYWDMEKRKERRCLLLQSDG